MLTLSLFHAWDIKNSFDKEGTSNEKSDQIANIRNDGDQCIAQSMAVDNNAFAQSFCTRCADKILSQDFEHLLRASRAK